MKLSKIIIIIICVLPLKSIGQTLENKTFSCLEKELIKFLIEKKDILEFEVEKYKNGKSRLNISGAQNNYRKGELKDGIYIFSQTRTHVRLYFVIVEENNFTILDISNREGLEISIKNTLDFCERKKYCQKITGNYVTGLIRAYYTKNRTPTAGMDINCERGVRNTKDLP